MLINFFSRKAFKKIYFVSSFTFDKYCRMCNLPAVCVKNFEEEKTLNISFNFGDANIPAQKFSFLRLKDEQLKSALARIRCKIQSSVLQKSKRKKLANNAEIVLPELNIVLMKNGVKVEEDSKNVDVWTPETDVIINNKTYKIIFNPPTVTSISLPKRIVSGALVYPKVNLEFSSIANSMFKWYRQSLNEDESTNCNKDIIKVENENLKCIYEGFLYNVSNSDIGYKLKVSCVPQSKDNLLGEGKAIVSENAVLSGPKRFSFEDRHNHTKELTKFGSYRFVSYNILADCYADTETARNELFAHCPVEFLDVEYRKLIYLKELIGYNADIMCLQEVDKKIFHDDLLPIFSLVGFSGIFNEKAGNTTEGLSCFYRDSKLKLIESHSIIISEAIKTKQVFHKLYKKICENEKLHEKFITRSTALQVSLFETLDTSNKKILVGNTHLYFHPESDNIRMLQATCCLLYLENILQNYQEKDPSSKISLVLSGDFNSCPEFGVFKLVTEGFLPSSCEDWNSNPEEKVCGIDFSHSLQLKSACGRPQYTNYTKEFFGCLDYIFYDKSLLKVTQVVPLPTHETVTEHIALPSQSFPSDHIALVCTLSWK